MAAARDKARETGPQTFEVVRRMFDEAKVKEQPMQTAKAILSIADIYSPEILKGHVRKRSDNTTCLITGSFMPMQRA